MSKSIVTLSRSSLGRSGVKSIVIEKSIDFSYRSILEIDRILKFDLSQKSNILFSCQFLYQWIGFSVVNPYKLLLCFSD